MGVVHDTSQSLVPGAIVKIRSLEDNSTRTATSDQNGAFEFVNLKPGNYALSAEAEGFAEFKVPSAELTARQALRIDVTMGVKTQVQTVEVASTVMMVEVKELLMLMDTDKNGKISKQEWMAFMEAEFDRLDKAKNGQLDVLELTQSKLPVSHFLTVGK